MSTVGPTQPFIGNFGVSQANFSAEEAKFGPMNAHMTAQFNRRVNVSVCALNQWALDWEGNLERALTAIRRSHSAGSNIHVGVELELCGYSCLDHFFERDTETHCWESLAKILDVSRSLDNMVIVTGMPIRFRAAVYNCMIVLAAGQVGLIHPKSALCDDDVYRESRYFKSWKHGTECQPFNLRQHGIDQDDVPFGHGIVETKDGVKIAVEICEELWCPKSPSVEWALQGVDVICNGSGSHHILGKSAKKITELMKDASSKLGGIYLYSNSRGFDGDRVLFDGMSAILQNGAIYKYIEQFDLEDVEIATAVLDLNESEIYRGKIASLGELSSRSALLKTIPLNVEIVVSKQGPLSTPINPTFYTTRQELFHAPSAYLWHYLRRSTAAGYFLALSGGADSAAVAAIVYLMCDKVCQAVKRYQDQGIKLDQAFYLHNKPVTETDPKKLANRLFYVCYMKSVNSSIETETRARNIAECLGANFGVQSIDSIVDSFKTTFADSHGLLVTHSHADYRAQLALENIQARARMVLSYLNAQLLPVTAGLTGSLLVLSSSNVDESLVGYLTKYDCSSADINPIGSINKVDLKVFLQDFAALGFEPYQHVIAAPPTAELRPLREGESKPQTDEDEIGVTYAQLQEIGLLRKPGYHGLFSMFFALSHRWNHLLPTETAEVVIKYFTRYIRNRHKSAVSTPALVCNKYCVDDQRTDHRPIVYPNFAGSFQRLREIARNMLEHKP